MSDQISYLALECPRCKDVAIVEWPHPEAVPCYCGGGLPFGLATSMTEIAKVPEGCLLIFRERKRKAWAKKHEAHVVYG